MFMLVSSLNLKKIGLISLALFMLSLLAFNFNLLTISAAIPDDIKNSACEGIHAGGTCDSTAGNSISSLFSVVINLLSWVVGVISVIMIIVGGFKFILSNGDPAGAKSARSTVIYALVGVAVAALAQVMVRFVLNQTSKI